MNTPFPFLKWAGGKRQLLAELTARIPPEYSTYYEPFLGGGALFFHLQPQKACLSDLNVELINLYDIVKCDVEDLIRELSEYKNDKEFYYKIRGVDRCEAFENWSGVKRAARMLYLNKTCFNGLYRVNAKGHFNTPFAGYKSPLICDSKNLRACSDALRNVKLEVASFLDVEALIQEGDFVYFDPPYVPINKTSSFINYTKEGFNETMQLALRDLCVRLNARGVKFMVSNSDTKLVNDLYSNFNIERVFAKRAINCNAHGRGKIAELIIRNYSSI